MPNSQPDPKKLRFTPLFQAGYFVVGRRLAKGIGAFPEKTLALDGDNGNSADLGFDPIREATSRARGILASTKTMASSGDKDISADLGFEIFWRYPSG